MRSSILIVPLAISIFSSVRVAAGRCASSSPIFIDLETFQTAPDSEHQYGLAVGFGTPAQKVPLMPSLRQNETTISAPSFCDNSTAFNSVSACEVAIGAFFDVHKSTSWTESSSSNDSLVGSDSLHIYPATVDDSLSPERAPTEIFPASPVQVQLSGENKPLLGLGPGSSLLTHADDDGYIPGRTYSLFVGTASARAGGNVVGTLVLGGYDASRFVGPLSFHEFDTSSPDVLSVRVLDVLLNTDGQDGQPVSLLDRGRFPDTPDDLSAGFTAKLSTEQYPISLPPSVLANFKSRVKVTEPDGEDGSLRYADDSESESDGESDVLITIVLSDGFEVSFPAEIMRSSSGLAPIASQADDTDDAFYFGTAFLSQLYLMVDQSESGGRFALAKAATGDPTKVSPRSWCGGEVPVSQADGARPSTGPSTSGASHKGSIVAVVLGSVLGGVAFCVALVATFLYVRAYRKNREEKEQGGADGNSVRFKNSDDKNGVTHDDDEDDDEDDDCDEIEKYSGRLRPYWPPDFDSPAGTIGPSPSPTMGSSLSLPSDGALPSGALPAVYQIYHPQYRHDRNFGTIGPPMWATFFQQPASVAKFVRQRQVWDYTMRVKSEDREKMQGAEAAANTTSVKTEAEAEAKPAQGNNEVEELRREIEKEVRMLVEKSGSGAKAKRKFGGPKKRGNEASVGHGSGEGLQQQQQPKKQVTFRIEDDKDDKKRRWGLR